MSVENVTRIIRKLENAPVKVVVQGKQVEVPGGHFMDTVSLLKQAQFILETRRQECGIMLYQAQKFGGNFNEDLINLLSGLNPRDLQS